METFELVTDIVFGFALSGFVVLAWLFVFVWPETRVGKLNLKNDRLEKMIVQKDLEIDLLKRKNEYLYDKLYGDSEDPTDE